MPCRALFPRATPRLGVLCHARAVPCRWRAVPLRAVPCHAKRERTTFVPYQKCGQHQRWGLLPHQRCGLLPHQRCGLWPHHRCGRDVACCHIRKSCGLLPHQRWRATSLMWQQATSLMWQQATCPSKKSPCHAIPCRAKVPTGQNPTCRAVPRRAVPAKNVGANRSVPCHNHPVLQLFDPSQ